MILVADASFAAKVLLVEVGSELAHEWWADEDVTWASPALVMSEVESAIHVHHRHHTERFDERGRRQASATWREMVSDMQIHTVDAALAERAVTTIQQFGPVRGADAVYLAVALELQGSDGDDVVLGSFDRQQREAANRAGLSFAPSDIPR